MIVAYVFVGLLALLAILQLLLVLGLPLGRIAWGGQHEVLPASLRVGAAASLLVYAFLATIVLDHAGVADLYPTAFSSVAIWVAFVFLLLAAVPNAMSRSRAERFIMTPVSLVLAVLVLVVALGGAPRQTYSGMVLDDGSARGPVFCTVVMESWPPQCGDPVPVAGWSWDGLEHWDEQGQRWGDYTFDGVLAGGVITVLDAPE